MSKLFVFMFLVTTCKSVEANDQYCYNTMHFQLTMLSVGVEEVGGISTTNTLENHKLKVMFEYFDEYPHTRKFQPEIIAIITTDDVFDWDQLNCASAPSNPHLGVS